MKLENFIYLAADLETAGLEWVPEIGDEISDRRTPEYVSILVDPDGMSPRELRTTYLWLPTVEQIVAQFEARQAVLFHMGLELTSAQLCYKTVIQARARNIETVGTTVRSSLAVALKELLIHSEFGAMQ